MFSRYNTKSYGYPLNVNPKKFQEFPSILCSNMVTVNSYSFLLPIKINLRTSSAYFWPIRASFYAFLLISKLIKVEYHSVYSISGSWSGILFTIFARFVAEDEQFEADKAQVVKEIDAL